MMNFTPRQRASVSLTLPFFLCAGYLSAGVRTPIGMVRAEGNVYIGQHASPTGFAVYSGDELRTGSGRAVVSLPQGDTLRLERDSQVVLETTPRGVRIDHEKGRLALSVSGRAPVSVEITGLRLSPAPTLASLAEISLPGDGSVVVAVHRGAMAIQDLRQQPVVVRAGQLITILPTTAQSQSSKVGTAAHGKRTFSDWLRTFKIGGLSHGASAALVGGLIVGGAATAVIVPLALEEAAPVSPVNP